tara:strand:+ start:349 stop:849 length:501 start_codon:yes stop_codon:yes gene_type:complete
MVRLIQLSDTTIVNIPKTRLLHGKAPASCIVTGFAIGEEFNAHKPPGSSGDNYVATVGARITTVAFGSDGRLSEGVELSQSKKMQIMAAWYLENIHPVLVAEMELPDTDDGKMNGFAFWIFDNKHQNIVLTGWTVARITDNWGVQIQGVGGKVEAGETFEKATGLH